MGVTITSAFECAWSPGKKEPGKSDGVRRFLKAKENLATHSSEWDLRPQTTVATAAATGCLSCHFVLALASPFRLSLCPCRRMNECVSLRDGNRGSVALCLSRRRRRLLSLTSGRSSAGSPASPPFGILARLVVNDAVIDRGLDSTRSSASIG